MTNKFKRTDRGWEVAGKSASKSAKKRGTCWWCCKNDTAVQPKADQQQTQQQHKPAPWKTWTDTTQPTASPKAAAPTAAAGAPSAKTDRVKQVTVDYKKTVHTWQQDGADDDDDEDDSNPSGGPGQNSSQEEADKLVVLKEL